MMMFLKMMIGDVDCPLGLLLSSDALDIASIVSPLYTRPLCLKSSYELRVWDLNCKPTKHAHMKQEKFRLKPMAICYSLMLLYSV